MTTWIGLFVFSFLICVRLSFLNNIHAAELTPHVGTSSLFCLGWSEFFSCSQLSHSVSHSPSFVFIFVAFMKQNAKSHPSHEKYCLKECNMRPTES